MYAPHQRLFINIDHVATIRQARRADQSRIRLPPQWSARTPAPTGSPRTFAKIGVTSRIADIERLVTQAADRAQLRDGAVRRDPRSRERLRPREVTIVPERREEVTTEGGLDVRHDPDRLARGIERIRAAGIRCSLFIDPEPDAVARSRDAGADAIELHTGRYAHHPDDPTYDSRAASRPPRTGERKLGLAVHAGHGLTVRMSAPWPPSPRSRS